MFLHSGTTASELRLAVDINCCMQQKQGEIMMLRVVDC